MRFCSLLAVAGTIAVTSLADAQARTEPVLRPGARVRYVVPHTKRPFSGLVEQVDTLGMLVRADGGDLRIRLGFDSLTSIAVYGGTRSSVEGARRGATTGLLIGLALGTVATTAVWLSSADEQCDDCFISATAATAGVSAIGTLGLTLLGSALGASAPGDLWTELPLRAFRRRSP